MVLRTFGTMEKFNFQNFAKFLPKNSQPSSNDNRNVTGLPEGFIMTVFDGPINTRKNDDIHTIFASLLQTSSLSGKITIFELQNYSTGLHSLPQPKKSRSSLEFALGLIAGFGALQVYLVSLVGDT